MIINLFITLYPEKNESRRSELLYCLKKNIDNRNIRSIYILDEYSNFSLNYEKLFFKKVDRRPTFNDFFDFINEKTSPESINMIANSDIYFDDTIGLLKYINMEQSCFALARWETGNYSPRLNNRNDSQDVWIFQGKIKEVNGDFPVGVPRCDNRLLYELRRAGYEVINPAYSIKSYHHHAGKRPTYSTRNQNYFVDPPYRYLYPHNLFGLWKTLWFNAKNKHKLAPYRYDIKKINKWYAYRFLRKVMEILLNKKLPLIGITEK